jgi:transcriptional regulator GlxA family with amidase domain
VTTHLAALDLLRQVAPNATVESDRRFVDNGRVICSAGIVAGIDMSLHVVEKLLGEDVARKTGRQMEYPWKVSPRYRRSEYATLGTFCRDVIGANPAYRSIAWLSLLQHP